MAKITMKDIAERVGVSKTTVSMVINKKDGSISEETKQKIYDVIKETGYIPNNIARGLNTMKSGTIAIIVPDISNPFFSELSRAVEDTANKLGYNVLLCNSDNNTKKEQKYVELLISKLIDGTILIPGNKSEDSARILKANGIPFVFVDRCIDGFEGYKKIMKQYEIFNENLIFEGKFSLEGGIDITNTILDSNEEIDSIFYCNDVMAIGGMKALKRRGYHIPNDISIMGFDGIKLSKMIEPELTTVQQPIYEMGEKACKLIIKLIDSESNKDKSVYFEPEIVVGGTV